MTGVPARDTVHAHELLFRRRDEVRRVHFTPMVDTPQSPLVHDHRTVVRVGSLELWESYNNHQTQDEGGHLHEHFIANRRCVDTSIDVKERLGKSPVLATKNQISGVVSKELKLVKVHVADVGGMRPAADLGNVHRINGTRSSPVVAHDHIFDREQERLYVEETILGQSHVASAEGVEVLQEVAKIPSLALGDLNLPDEG